MKSQIRLSAEDHQCLNMLARGEHPESRLAADKALLLGAILTAAKVYPEAPNLAQNAGLYDLITLVSPTDTNDRFVLSIVLPSEEDLDQDRVGLDKDVALAVLGRNLNERVSWQTPGSTRVMSISRIRKAANPSVA